MTYYYRNEHIVRAQTLRPIRRAVVFIIRTIILGVTMIRCSVYYLYYYHLDVIVTARTTTMTLITLIIVQIFFGNNHCVLRCEDKGGTDVMHSKFDMNDDDYFGERLRR